MQRWWRIVGLPNLWTAGDLVSIQFPLLILEPTASGAWAGVRTLYLLLLSWDRQAPVLLGGNQGRRETIKVGI